MPRIPQYEEATRRTLGGLHPGNEAITAFRQEGRIAGEYGVLAGRLLERGYGELARGVGAIGSEITRAQRAQEKAAQQQQSLLFTQRFVTETSQYKTDLSKLLGVGMTIPGLGKFSPTGGIPEAIPVETPSEELETGGALETQ